jgi:hypothetical protein
MPPLPVTQPQHGVTVLVCRFVKLIRAAYKSGKIKKAATYLGGSLNTPDYITAAIAGISFGRGTSPLTCSDKLL